MKITCTRPNASEEINGIPFTRQEDGSVVATGVSAEDAAAFADFEGYTVEDEKEPAQAAVVANSLGAEPTASASVEAFPSDSADVAVVDAAPADAATTGAGQEQADTKPAKRK